MAWRDRLRRLAVAASGTASATAAAGLTVGVPVPGVPGDWDGGWRRTAPPELTVSRAPMGVSDGLAFRGKPGRLARPVVRHRPRPRPAADRPGRSRTRRGPPRHRPPHPHRRRPAAAARAAPPGRSGTRAGGAAAGRAGTADRRGGGCPCHHAWRPGGGHGALRVGLAEPGPSRAGLRRTGARQRRAGSRHRAGLGPWRHGIRDPGHGDARTPGRAGCGAGRAGLGLGPSGWRSPASRRVRASPVVARGPGRRARRRPHSGPPQGRRVRGGRCWAPPPTARVAGRAPRRVRSSGGPRGVAARGTFPGRVPYRLPLAVSARVALPGPRRVRSSPVAARDPRPRVRRRPLSGPCRVRSSPGRFPYRLPLPSAPVAARPVRSSGGPPAVVARGPGPLVRRRPHSGGPCRTPPRHRAAPTARPRPQTARCPVPFRPPPALTARVRL